MRLYEGANTGSNGSLGATFGDYYHKDKFLLVKLVTFFTLKLFKLNDSDLIHCFLFLKN